MSTAPRKLVARRRRGSPGARLAIFLIFLGLTPPAAAGGDDAPPLSAHLQQVDADLLIAGELNLEALAAEHPVSTTVIDLRTAEEGTAGERAAVDALGMRYVNLPVDGAEIREEDVARLRSLLEEASGQPVILHCASGNRAAMLWGAVQLEAGLSLSDVLSRVSDIDIKPAVADALRARAAGERSASGTSSTAQGASAR